MNNTIKILGSLLTSSAFLISCGGDVDGFSDRPTSAIGIISSSHFSVGLSEINPEVIVEEDDPNSTATPPPRIVTNHGGVDVTITATAGDRVNAKVTSGTVYFMVEYGLLSAGSCTIDSTGTCSITWTSELDFSLLHNYPASYINAITAYTQGEEAFIDTQTNGALDAGETFIDTDEPFLDRDDNGSYTLGTDYYIDVDGDGLHTAGDTFYNGASCNDTPRCSATTIKTIYARTSMDLYVVK